MIIQEEFSCVRDGLTIRGTVLRPEGSGKVPTVIASHGFMSNRNTVKKEAQMFAARGFAVVAFDFNGGGPGSKSDGKSTEMSVLTEKADLLAVFAAVRALDFVDPADITLCGFSQGGFVSALVAAELQEQVRRLILFFPALCIPDDARAGRMMFARFDPKNIPETFRCGFMKLGRCYAADVVDLDPYPLIEGYRGPVLMIHGTADKVVDISYSRRAYEAYLAQRGGKPAADCQLVTIDKANHGFRGLFSRGWLPFAFFAIEKFIEGKAPILNVDVHLTTTEVDKLPDAKRLRLHFTGGADGMYFTGAVREGAFDEQMHVGGKPDTCHADYFVDGTDYLGKPCSVNICNDMPSGEPKDWAKGWVPTVRTESAALSFLNGQQCETYARMRRCGPYIHIFAKPAPRA